jgi:quercetin 2,3-dioxygenase
MERNSKGSNGITGTGIFVQKDAERNVHRNEVDELHPLESIPAEHTGADEQMQVLHKAGTRGYANHGWLVSHQSFSFADYYNPDRMHFGVLRVLNDDWVAPAMGFGRHPHDNMEIISIPLEGVLEHTDSMGNKAVLKQGDIQVMSAGTGIFHTEYNRNTDQPATFLQIWVFPSKKNVTPRYDQLTLNLQDRHNRFQQILSPHAGDQGVWVHQDAWFHIGRFDKGIAENYTLKKAGNGVYIFVIKGQARVGKQLLEERDGLGVWNTGSITIEMMQQDTELLLMEVPMSMQ